MQFIISLPVPTGWDIANRNMADACREAKVLDVQLQDQLRPFLQGMNPRPSIYCPDFIAANQEDRANNVLTGEWDGFAIARQSTKQPMQTT